MRASLRGILLMRNRARATNTYQMPLPLLKDPLKLFLWPLPAPISSTSTIRPNLPINPKTEPQTSQNDNPSSIVTTQAQCDGLIHTQSVLLRLISPSPSSKMDAHALLTSQGWRGSGHSLHKNDDAIGLAKPILASRKNNTLGIGRKNHVTSDQWWLNAFDEQLKGLDTSNKTSVVQTNTKPTRLDGLLTHGAGKYTGANALYACFVSGGMLHGTLQPAAEVDSTDATPEAEVVPVKKETKEERRARREQRRRRKTEKSEKLEKQTAAATDALEAANKAMAKIHEKTREQSEEQPKEGKSKKSKSKLDRSKKVKVEKDKTSKKKSVNTETKEERRARKEAKRKEKAKKEKRQKVEKG